MSTLPETAQQLVELGFSHYEARAYLGLLGQDPMTGYALSNVTQVPQPKVYETLRRLLDKRAVVQVGSEPATFVAVPPDHLLENVDSDFRRRLADARLGLSRLRPAAEQEFRVVRALTDWPAIVGHSEQMIAHSERHVYLSAHADQLADLATCMREADARGVRLDVLCFGKVPVTLAHGRILSHASTEGVLYRHHQARHLALVVDSVDALWALAADGSSWDAMTAPGELLVALVKGYIRHDAYIQEIYAEFRDVLRERYGPGLAKLVVTPPDQPLRRPAGKSRAATGRRARPA
jgi:sugar-specific transcriptional regulator TrmB